MYVNICTDNKSFFQYAMGLKNTGIKNWGFCLHQIDDSIEAIDPHDPGLTVAEQERVITECRDNPWYFFREVLRIPSATNKEGVQFHANETMVSSLFLMLNGKDSLVFTPRQRGRSMMNKVFSFYNAKFHGKGMVTLSINRPIVKADQFVLAEMNNLLPEYMQTRVATDLTRHPYVSAPVARLNEMEAPVHSTVYCSGGYVASIFIPNKGDDDGMLKELVELAPDYLCWDDAPFHRAQYEVESAVHQYLALERELGSLITAPLEAEERVRAHYHRLMETTDNKTYWNKAYYDRPDDITSGWRIEPMVSKDIATTAAALSLTK
ncbi:hypothetical protein [Vibrio phage vB_pir03]|nr:hypothetical protein [Vibrio phage vB_pir03]